MSNCSEVKHVLVNEQDYMEDCRVCYRSMVFMVRISSASVKLSAGTENE